MGKAYEELAPTCPSTAVLERIGSRWTIFVFTALSERPMRFGELKNRIHGISSKVLTETLRALETDGLVSRSTVESEQGHVEYALTELGTSLWEPLSCVKHWADTHIGQILAAQEKMDCVTTDPDLN